MIKVSYEYSDVKPDDLMGYKNKIENIISKFKNKDCEGNEYLGWYDFVDKIDGDLIEDIKRTAKNISETCDVFVLCGIGGSYLGARAVIEAVRGFFKSKTEIVYIGNTFDERYVKDVIEYLKDKNFCVNVISKSGTTLETSMSFRLLRELLEEKYGELAKNRIIATTDKENGLLREISLKEGYKMYYIPSDIGGRYSVFTAVGLLPIAVAGIDIEKFLNGAKEAKADADLKLFDENVAHQYAAYRYYQYKNQNKSVETFVSYSPYLNMISEWWKQLFGESEGKDRMGLYPTNLNFSTDLHSLGQFIQEGSKILFITQLKVIGQNNLFLNKREIDDDNLNYLKDISFNKMNLFAQEGTNKAHHEYGDVDNFTFEIHLIDEWHIGYLLYTLMYSCMISSYLLGVNPFNQPGVEFYKKEMKNLIKK